MGFQIILHCVLRVIFLKCKYPLNYTFFVSQLRFIYTHIQLTVCFKFLQVSKSLLVAEIVKNPLAMWETWVWSLDQEDPLEEGMATHSSILAWEIPWTEESGGLQSLGSQRVRHSWSNGALSSRFLELKIYGQGKETVSNHTVCGQEN